MADEHTIRVLSFNIWRSGGLSLEATIEAIAHARADVVGLQECSAEATKTIARVLDYAYVHDDNAHAILTPRVAGAAIEKIGSTRNVWGGLGATIDVPSKADPSKATRVHVFDAHLHWDHYGPYLLQEERSPASVLDEERVMRMPGLDELFAMMDPFLARGEGGAAPADPVFLLGDFNAPSHLDYADMAWPTSIACEARGLVDAYRALHPSNRVCTPDDPFRQDEPGITWSSMLAEEPRGCFDRIDFIHYAAAPAHRTRPLESFEIDGQNGGVKTWPSDHRAVLGVFAVG